MPLTGAEKMRHRREKLKRLGKYEDFKAKQRQQAKKNRDKVKILLNELPEREMNKRKEEIRKKTRERVQKCRDKKKKLKNDQPKHTLYSSAKTFGKAKSRVKKALPACPLRKKAILQKLLEEINLEPLTSKPQSKHCISDGVVTKVKQFYERDDISRQAPGLKDVKTIREGKIKWKQQIRHLLTPINEAYAIFVEENGKLLGKSKFAELRPQHVLLSSVLPRNVCLCRCHENYILAVNSLNNITKTFPAFDSSFLYNILCKTPTKDCWSNQCSECHNKLNEQMIRAIQNIENLPCKVTWPFWMDDGKERLCKTIQSGNINSLRKHILEMTPSFKLHSFFKKSQSRSYEKDKNAAIKNINVDASLLQVDFSENYTCVAQDEVQSFHWVQPQVTLFTMSLWHSGKHFPIVIVSDNQHHTKDTIVPFMERALEELPENIKEVHVWSDGPASQFKNRFIAASLVLLEKKSNKKIIWNYFATSHGKGPADGIGGALKRIIRLKVISRAEVVFNAQHFAQVANKYSNVKVIEMGQEEIESRVANLKLETVFEEALHIEGIAKVHNIYTNNGEVRTESITLNSKIIKEKSHYNTVYGFDDSNSIDNDIPLSTNIL